jgi:hypothetical protein
MLRSALALRGYRIEATDGEIGKVHDLFFDDVHWDVRYIVADTGKWLRGRKVLLSPASLGQPQWEQHTFPVALTKEQIEKSPDVETDQPVSRQREKDVVDYFAWPIYWAAAPSPAAPITSSIPPPNLGRRAQVDFEQPESLDADPNLRSMREAAGYYIQAADGDIGHVDDFVVDDEVWRIRYVVVDTRNWLPGGKVILAPDWFSRFDWQESRAVTGLDKETIKHAHKYDPTQPVNRDYEGELYDYYGRPAYWLGDRASAIGEWRV